MKVFDTKNIKNIALLGHSGGGKTTLAEAMLFEAGEISRRGTVEGKNTVSDYHPIEHERGNSIFATLMHMEWKGNKINMIDTPGFDDFVGEVIASLKVADTGVMVLNAQNGVEVGTEIIWEYTEKFRTPMIFVINQVDSDKADFDGTAEQAKARFGDNVCVVQYPLNPGNDFDTIVDVLKMVMYKFPEGGGKPEKLPIPDSEKDKAEQLHNELVEAIAVNDDSLMELYFEKGELTEEEMTNGLKKSMINHDIFPVFCCSARKNMGSGRVMGFIHDIAPATIDMPRISRKSGEKLECDPEGPICAFVYKTASEPNLGNMSFFKLYSGTLHAGTDLLNSESENSERINQLFLVNGKNRTPVNMLKAGDIGVTVKLKDTATNSSLYEKGRRLRISPIEFPEPRIRVAVETDNKNDMEKLAMALHQIEAEDPTLRVEASAELNQTIVMGQGELHLAMVKWKIEHQYGVEFNYIKPRIPFRETIRKEVRSSYRHKKQSGGAGQFGEVYMAVEPYYEGKPMPPDLTVRRDPDITELDWGGKFVFYNCVVGGAIDAKFMSAISKGIMEKLVDGPLTGSYVRDVRVSVYDGKMHPVDSNDMAFKLAASHAFKQAFQEANPQLLEPIYDVEVLVDSEAMGDVMGDLQNRRAMIMGMETAGHYQKIKAKVPLMELYKYSSALRSLSQGKAKHTETFAEYSPVPADIQQRLIAEYKEHLQEA